MNRTVRYELPKASLPESYTNLAYLVSIVKNQVSINIVEL